MERKDLVTFVITLRDGTSVTICTHRGTDSDEGTGAKLIMDHATSEWLERNSQTVPVNDPPTTVFLGVGNASQRGVFNEHTQRDQGGDNSECCATMVARSLGIIEVPAVKRLVAYILGKDSQGKGAKYDATRVLQLWRKLRLDNTEAMRWFFKAIDLYFEEQRGLDEMDGNQLDQLNLMAGGILDVRRLSAFGAGLERPGVREWLLQAISVFIESENRTKAAAEWAKNHLTARTAHYKGRRVKWYLVESDDDFAVDGLYSILDGPKPVIVRVESSGHFQIFPNNARLSVRILRRLIHRIAMKSNFIPDAVRTKSLGAQIAWANDEQPAGERFWEDRVYFHPATGFIMNGSLTARPTNLIGTTLTEQDLVDVVEAALEEMLGAFARRDERRQAPTTKPQPTTPAAPTTPTPTPESEPADSATPTPSGGEQM